MNRPRGRLVASACATVDADDTQRHHEPRPTRRRRAMHGDTRRTRWAQHGDPRGRSRHRALAGQASVACGLVRAAHARNLCTASPDRRCAHRFLGTCIEKQSEMRTYNTTCQRYKVRYDDGQVFAVPPAPFAPRPCARFPAPRPLRTSPGVCKPIAFFATLCRTACTTLWPV